MTRFSVLIPSWNNLPYLDLAYRGLRRNSAVEHEIIVFFNEQSDETRAWAAAHPDVVCEGADENLGVCPAVNRAAACANTDYVCFMNDDMYPLPGWDTALSVHLGIGEPLWLSGTAVEPGDATACYIGGCDYGTTPASFDEARLLRDCASIRRPYNMVSTWTPILLRRADWEAVGGFDEAYFPGNGSDPDLAMKLYQHGCRHFIGVGTSLVYHFSRTTVSRFGRACDAEAKAYFENKWGMTWKRFLRKKIRRDEVITPELLRWMERS